MNEIINKIKTFIKSHRIDNETGSGFINADIEKLDREFIRDLKEIYKLVYEKRDALSLQQKHIDKKIAEYKQKIAYQASKICRIRKYYKTKLEEL